MIKRFDCVGVGLCPLDRILLVPNYPAPNEKTEAVASMICGGGPVPNAIYTLAKLGNHVAFCGKVGEDLDGLFVINELRDAGVETSGMTVAKGARTAAAQIWVEKGTGKRAVVLDRTAISPPVIDEIPPYLLENCRSLLIDGRGGDFSVSAAQSARRSGAKVALDLGSMRDNLKSLLPEVDIIIASEDFSRAYCPDGTPMETAQRLIEEGMECAVITLGERGCVWKDSSGEGIFPAFKIEALDTTGAGDVFHGAFIHGMLKGWGMEKIIRFSSAAAALSCLSLGGRGGVESAGQVWEFIENHHSMDSLRESSHPEE